MAFATDPVAYFLTWTCKGTRLHGDPRGSVDRAHNTFGTPRLEPDPERQAAEAARMVDPPIELSESDRQLVEATVGEVAAHRGWTLVAVAVRSNHVHMVVENPGCRPEKVMNDFKAWTTRRLREAGRWPTDTHGWTRHGSTRYLWNERQVAAAAEYVQEAQDLPR